FVPKDISQYPVSISDAGGIFISTENSSFFIIVITFRFHILNLIAMKNILRIFIAFAIISNQLSIAYAQAPQSMNYQAVARDAGGNTIVSQLVGLRFSILTDSIGGS